MNEITKLYENAGVEPTCQFKGLITGTCQNVVNFYYNLSCQEEDCKNFSAFAKVFTAEKQLELIKWLADTDNYIKEICRMIDTRRYCIKTIYKNISMANNFEEALAGLINNLWQNLSPEEKQQVKGILE